MLSRAFDHICIEKARYEFLIIIIIVIIIIIIFFLKYAKWPMDIKVEYLTSTIDGILVEMSVHQPSSDM